MNAIETLYTDNAAPHHCGSTCATYDPGDELGLVRLTCVGCGVSYPRAFRLSGTVRWEASAVSRAHRIQAELFGS